MYYCSRKSSSSVISRTSVSSSLSSASLYSIFQPCVLHVGVVAALPCDYHQVPLGQSQTPTSADTKVGGRPSSSPRRWLPTDDGLLWMAVDVVRCMTLQASTLFRRSFVVAPFDTRRRVACRDPLKHAVYCRRGVSSSNSLSILASIALRLPRRSLLD